MACHCSSGADCACDAGLTLLTYLGQGHAGEKIERSELGPKQSQVSGVQARARRRGVKEKKGKETKRKEGCCCADW